jgi:hypothetical protein
VGELLKIAEKVEGADSRFREAAEARKDAEDKLARAEAATKYRAAVETMLNSSEESEILSSFMTVANGLGVKSPAQAEKLWYALFPASDGAPEETPSKGAGATESSKPLTLKDLPAEVLEVVGMVQRLQKSGVDPERTLQLSRNALNLDASDRGAEMVRDAIRKHPDLGRVRRTRGPEAEAKLVTRTLAGLEGQVSQGKPLAQALADAVADTADFAKLFAVEEPTDDQLSPFGLGVGPRGARRNFNPEKPPKLDPQSLGKPEGLRSTLRDIFDQEFARREDNDEASG